MRLEDLDGLDAFALLGPGYSAAGRPVLLTDLVPGGRDAALLFAPFEVPGREARAFDGRARPFDLDAPDTAGAAQAVPAAAERGRAAAGPPFALDAAGHAAAVGAIREAIARGDVYQVNLALRVPLPAQPGSTLARAMWARGLPRYGAWVRLPGGEEWVSGSPELLFEMEGGRIRSEPMKGTAAAGAGAWLEDSAKDRAELAMITDLVRNDLVPICRPRTVRVPCERRLVALPYAVQAVSEVAGDLLPGVGPRDALAALHPGGSVTGAPREAALEMIRRLEPWPRGAYCGALALRDGGRCTAALLIRTASRSPGGWVYGVGGGIVHASDASLELEEVRVKLAALGGEGPAGAPAPAPEAPGAAYTTLRVDAGGVVLLEEHARRLAPQGGPALERFHAFARTAAPGVYAIATRGDGLDVTARRGSTLFDGMPWRLAPSPVGRAPGPFPKPAPPGPYAAVRAPGVATLLTSPDGTEIWEACVAAVVGWDGERLVLVPDDRPRVDSTAERAIAARLPVARAPILAASAMPLLLVNAVKGTCTLAPQGRAPFPPAPLRAIEGVLAARTGRPAAPR